MFENENTMKRPFENTQIHTETHTEVETTTLSKRKYRPLQRTADQQTTITQNNIDIIIDMLRMQDEDTFYKFIVEHYTANPFDRMLYSKICIAIENTDFNKKILYLFEKSAKNNDHKLDGLLRDLTTRKFFYNYDENFTPKGFGITSSFPSQEQLAHFYESFSKTTEEAQWFMLQYASKEQLIYCIEKLTHILMDLLSAQTEDPKWNDYKNMYKMIKSEQFYRNFQESFQEESVLAQQSLLSEKEVFHEQILCFFRGRDTAQLELAMKTNKNVVKKLKAWIREKTPQNFYQLYHRRINSGKDILYRYATAEQKLYLFIKDSQSYLPTDTLTTYIQALTPINFLQFFLEATINSKRASLLTAATPKQMDYLLDAEKRWYMVNDLIKLAHDNCVPIQQPQDHNEDIAVSPTQCVLKRLSPLQNDTTSTSTENSQTLLTKNLQVAIQKIPADEFCQRCEWLSEEERWYLLDYATPLQLNCYIQKINASDEKKEYEKPKLLDAIYKKLLYVVSNDSCKSFRNTLLQKNFTHYFGDHQNFDPIFFDDFLHIGKTTTDHAKKILDLLKNSPNTNHNHHRHNLLTTTAYHKYKVYHAKKIALLQAHFKTLSLDNLMYFFQTIGNKKEDFLHELTRRAYGDFQQLFQAAKQKEKIRLLQIASNAQLYSILSAPDSSNLFPLLQTLLNNTSDSSLKALENIRKYIMRQKKSWDFLEYEVPNSDVRAFFKKFETPSQQINAGKVYYYYFKDTITQPKQFVSHFLGANLQKNCDELKKLSYTLLTSAAPSTFSKRIMNFITNLSEKQFVKYFQDDSPAASYIQDFLINYLSNEQVKLLQTKVTNIAHLTAKSFFRLYQQVCSNENTERQQHLLNGITPKQLLHTLFSSDNDFILHHNQKPHLFKNKLLYQLKEEQLRSIVQSLSPKDFCTYARDYNYSGKAEAFLMAYASEEQKQQLKTENENIQKMSAKDFFNSVCFLSYQYSDQRFFEANVYYWIKNATCEQLRNFLSTSGGELCFRQALSYEHTILKANNLIHNIPPEHKLTYYTEDGEVRHAILPTPSIKKFLNATM